SSIVAGARRAPGLELREVRAAQRSAGRSPLAKSVVGTSSLLACLAAVFPADNPLNEEVAGLPASPNSQAYVESIGLSAHLHPDFGNNPAYGIPYEVVGADQPKVPVKFTAYRSESDPGPYPVPAD